MVLWPPTALLLARQTDQMDLFVLRHVWLLRLCSDGGTEYVCFRPGQDRVEVVEGYHLPPQMPLIKRRKWLDSAEVPHCIRQLEKVQGFKHGQPLF